MFNGQYFLTSWWVCFFFFMRLSFLIGNLLFGVRFACFEIKSPIPTKSLLDDKSPFLSFFLLEIFQRQDSD